MSKKSQSEKFTLNRQAHKISSHKLFKPVLLLGIGIIIGLSSGFVVFGSDGRDSKPSSSNTQQALKQRSEDRYERAKQRIERAVEDGRLTQEQAEKLNAKIDELKKYVEENLGSRADWDEMGEKRDELRQWAKDNKIPYQYITSMY